MKVLPARFVSSVLTPSQFPKDGRPEVAFAGRSNVGKSSLLNTLLGVKGLAKTSGTPGKTQTINFYDIGGRYYFVDLPGYGYAKVPVEVKRAWSHALLSYLKERKPLKLVVQLLDARHPPTPRDIEMLELLEEAEKPTLLVATKCDKLTRTQRAENLHRIRTELALDDDALIIHFSAVTGEGKKELWNVITELDRVVTLPSTETGGGSLSRTNPDDPERRTWSLNKGKDHANYRDRTRS